MSETIETSPSASPNSRRTQEIFLLSLVSMAAIAANLPVDVLRPYGIEPRYIVAVLGIMVVLAMFFYLRFFFFLLYVLLAVGANVPEQWAAALGLSQLALLVTLGAMVGLSLLNYAIKLLPTGLEKPEDIPKQSVEGTKALLTAIERGNSPQVKQILSIGIDPNLAGDGGITPLMLAAQLGYADMVEALVTAGANPAQTNTEGQTARDLAFRKGFVAIVKQLTPPPPSSTES